MSRAQRTRKSTLRPDFVYSGVSLANNGAYGCNTSATESPPRRSKQEQLIWMKENPEKLITDTSLQKNASGDFVRDICDAKFYSERSDKWIAACSDFYNNRVSSKTDRGSIKLSISSCKPDIDKYVTISLFKKNNTIMIQGKATCLHTWIAHDFPTLRSIVSVMASSSSFLAPDTPAETSNQVMVSPNMVPKTIQNDSNTNSDHSSPSAHGFGTRIIPGNTSLEDIVLITETVHEITPSKSTSKRNHTVEDPSFHELSVSFESRHGTQEFQYLSDEFETIDEAEPSIYDSPKDIVDKLKKYEQLQKENSDMRSKLVNLRNELNKLTMKVNHLDSQNVILQQENMHQKAYIRQLSKQNETLSTSLHSLNMDFNFQFPKNPVRNMKQKSPGFIMPNRFSPLIDSKPDMFSSQDMFTSTPTAHTVPDRPKVDLRNKTKPHFNIDSEDDFPSLKQKSKVTPAPMDTFRKNGNHRQHTAPITKETTRTHTVPKKEMSQKQTAQRPVPKHNNNLVIIGDSMVRNLSENVRNISNFSPTAFVHPGATVERITSRLYYHTPKEHKPAHVLLHAGTNNIQQDEVGETIFKLDDMIMEAELTFPDSNILISGLTYRKDKPQLNNKIKAINSFLAHRCSKSKSLTFVDNSCHYETGRDGLHLTYKGKENFAKNIVKTLMNQSFRSAQKVTNR